MHATLTTIGTWTIGCIAVTCAYVVVREFIDCVRRERKQAKRSNKRK